MSIFILPGPGPGLCAQFGGLPPGASNLTLTVGDVTLETVPDESDPFYSIPVRFPDPAGDTLCRMEGCVDGVTVSCLIGPTPAPPKARAAITHPGGLRAAPPAAPRVEVYDGNP